MISKHNKTYTNLFISKPSTDKICFDFILEMKLNDAGIKVNYKKHLINAMQDIMNRLIKDGYSNNRYYIQTESLVSIIHNGRKITYPLFLASGYFDKKKIIYPNIEIIDKGKGVSHMISHINNIKKLKDKNCRAGINKYGKQIITTQVSFDCYEEALRQLETKLQKPIVNKTDGVKLTFNNKNQIVGVIIDVPVKYGDETLLFTFVIDIPIKPEKEISTIVTGYPQKDLPLNLKSHKK